jgi:myo-inositol-1(or 4)-monophosphatase
MSTDSSINARYQFALELIREAGELAHSYFKKFDSLTIKSKGLQDMASEADLNTELLIKERLQTHYPEDAFLGEETGLTTFDENQGIWIVDPIDGTQPFVSGLTSWCVSIAFMKAGILEFGLVYAPARDELFAGGRDYPATLNGQPLRKHPGKTIKDGIVAMGYSPRVRPEAFLSVFSRFIQAGGMYYRDGSGALNLCYVASGQLLGYLELHINSWDCLGGIAVLQAAGLITNDFLSNDGLRKGNAMIAGNAEVYAELLAIYEGKLL